MQRKLTITVSDEVYWGLHHHIGRGEISRFIETLVRPHVVTDRGREEEYREATGDEEAKREALVYLGPAPHKALADQIRTVAKERLREQMGSLSAVDMLAVERAIRVHLGLP